MAPSMAAAVFQGKVCAKNDLDRFARFVTSTRFTGAQTHVFTDRAHVPTERLRLRRRDICLLDIWPSDNCPHLWTYVSPDSCPSQKQVDVWPPGDLPLQSVKFEVQQSGRTRGEFKAKQNQLIYIYIYIYISTSSQIESSIYGIDYQM